MFEFKARVLLLLGWVAIGVTPLTLSQQSATNNEKEIKVPAVAREPRLILRISALERWGIVSVRNGAGAQVQSLACPLLRDEVEPTQPELAAVREQFVAQFQAIDLDSDGYPDLAGIREFGAKWARYCVWLYDPGQHIFVKNFLAAQMELLTNLSSSDGARILASRMGPTNPWEAVYRIAAAGGGWPERQLVPLLSCGLQTTADGDKPSILAVTRYNGGRAIVQRQDVTKMNVKEALGKCTSAESQAIK